MFVNAATAVCRCLPFKVPMPILNMLFPLLSVIYQIFPSPRKSAAEDLVVAEGLKAAGPKADRRSHRRDAYRQTHRR